MTQVEPAVRMFDILRSEERSCVVQGDLKSMLAGILLSHPGLEFLQDTPEFQDRYAETVILRIFYSLDRSGLGRITLRDLKRCDPKLQGRCSDCVVNASLALVRMQQCQECDLYSIAACTSTSHNDLPAGYKVVLAVIRGDLLSALLQLDKEDDVNKVLRYFSYEHFYVIYCKVCLPCAYRSARRLSCRNQPSGTFQACHLEAGTQQTAHLCCNQG